MPSSLSSLRCAPNGYLRTHVFFMRTAKILIRLGECPTWSESSLGSHAILLVLLWDGLNFVYRFQLWNDDRCVLFNMVDHFLAKFAVNLQSKITKRLFTLSMLGKKFDIWNIFFFIFTENKLWHFMHIAYYNRSSLTFASCDWWSERFL